MKTRSTFLLGALGLLVYSLSSQNLAIKNGQWFNGSSFEPKKTFYVNDGFFSNQAPETIDTVLDLREKFIIPPFAEVHTHNLSRSYGLTPIIGQYLAEGTFYVQVLGCSHQGRLEALPYLNSPKSIDAVYANGGITSTLGHPFQIYEPLAMGIYDPGERRSRFQEIIRSRLALNDAYWYFDEVVDVDRNWPALMDTKPDIIKIMLIEAENYGNHQDDSTRIGRKGLHPEVAAYVVKRAHEEGLKVYAHISTPADFRIGLDIGVDVFAHMPGYTYGGTGNPAEYALTPYDFQKAKAKGVTIIPTAYLAQRRLPRDDEAAREKALENVLAFQSTFFAQAYRHGIPMGLGSDDFGETLMKEVDYLYQYNLLSEIQLLNLMAVSGPKLCFPERKLGELLPDFEGSFLVLAKNPLDHFQTIKEIEMRVKKGVVLR